MVFPVVRMWELDSKDGWALKNWCFWTVVLEKTPESPLDCKEIQPVHSKGDQSWVFFGRNDAKAEIPVLWPRDAKSWLIWKDPDAGKDWRQEEKGTTKDEMVRWHHRLNGREFGQTPGVGDGQGGLACCSSWGCKESDTIEWLNWTEWLSWHRIPLQCGRPGFNPWVGETPWRREQLPIPVSWPRENMDCSTPGFPVLYYLPELAQTHILWVSDAIQPSCSLSSHSLAFNLSQHQGIFQWVSSLHEMAKVLELQLQHQSFQRIFRVDFL